MARHRLTETEHLVFTGDEVERVLALVDELVFPDGGDEMELIDETVAPSGPLDLDIAVEKERRPSADSAVPRVNVWVRSRATIPWGQGTDGWPRCQSRLVRLFFGEPAPLLAGAVGASWGRLLLDTEVRQLDDAEESLAVSGRLQMPYPSRPLSVELRAQPFERRFTRVDLVLLSEHRWPRRYFDVASRALTQLQLLEKESRLNN